MNRFPGPQARTLTTGSETGQGASNQARGGEGMSEGRKPGYWREQHPRGSGDWAWVISSVLIPLGILAVVVGALLLILG